MKSFGKWLVCLFMVAGLTMSGCSNDKKEDGKEKEGEKTSAVENGASDDGMTLVSVKLPNMT